MSLALRLVLVCIGAFYLARMILEAPRQLREAKVEALIFRPLIVARLVGIAVAGSGFLALSQ